MQVNPIAIYKIEMARRGRYEKEREEMIDGNRSRIFLIIISACCLAAHYLLHIINFLSYFQRYVPCTYVSIHRILSSHHILA